MAASRTASKSKKSIPAKKNTSRPSRKKPASKAKESKPLFTKSINPATLEETGEVQNTDMAKMPLYFEKAREAQKKWARFSYKERAKYILKMNDYILDHVDELAEVVSQDSGKSRIDALATEVIPITLAVKWYAKNAKKSLKGKNLKGSSLLFFNKKNRVIRVPLGVVGIISPWNYPLSIPFGEIIMGLMAGNAVMLKVAAATINVGVAIEKIIESAGLPEGLFYHIVGSGREVSESFFNNKISKIFFTGSVPTGKHLAAKAAETLTPLSLELGGKDPMIVMPDANLERAANGAAWAGYQNAGQSCGGVERIYVHESVYESFVDLLAEKTSRMRHGADIDYNVEMGAMTTEEQLDIVKEHVDDALKNGAQIVAQSESAYNADGYFYPATLMTGVNHSMTLMREETFGPVLPVMKFSTIEEAIELANDSTMALTSSVWTKNLKMGKKIAARLESGVTTINDHLYSHGQSETPWGGWKDSGLGRTHSAFGLEEMTQPKVINWDFLPSYRNIWWFPFDKNTYSALKAALGFSFPRSIFGFLRDSITLSVFLVKKMFSRWK